MSAIIVRSARRATPIWFVHEESWAGVQKRLPPFAAAFAAANAFQPKAGKMLIAPTHDGAMGCVLMGVEGPTARYRDGLLAGKLVGALPAGVYEFANDPPGGARGRELAATGWALSAYKFTRYLKSAANFPRLVAPAGVDVARVERIAVGHGLARDLINTPANDMGPAMLEDAAARLARKHRAQLRVVRGSALLKQNFPLIHAVGKAAVDEPRLVDFTWGSPRAPKVTLVGKGVCFDTGGLDIKPSSAMLLMKKDMAGAATALALAHMIMDARLNVRLRVLLPIVENAISGPAFRPGDIYPSRKGHTVEIGNTDAEGRLILADALALGDEEAPDLMFNFATLTGAARVALGPDLPPFYTMNDALAEEIAAHGAAVGDPVWRLPFWEPYDTMIDGKISTINNVATGPFAGSIIAALFLRRFVEKCANWAHFDIYAWNNTTKPGRPEGGDAQTARLLYSLIEKRYGQR